MKAQRKEYWKGLYRKHDDYLKELARYIGFGIGSLVINIVAFWVYNDLLKVHYMAANVVAWVLSVVFAFVTNKVFVFNSHSWKASVWIRECISFTTARVITGVFDMAIMFVMVDLINADELFAKFVANFFVILANYGISKLWIFKETGAWGKDK